MTSLVALTPQRSLREYSNDQLALIKKTVAGDCNNNEFDLFIESARRIGLDPIRKQIYAVVYSKDSTKNRKMSIVTGIDGFRAVAERSGKYRPDENEPEIVYDEKLENPDTNPLGIKKAIVTVHKIGPDQKWYPVKGVAWWDEFAPITNAWEWNEIERKNLPTGKASLPKGSMWIKMARIMIAKCAEAQAIRRGWPEDLSGVYSPEEMDQAKIIDISPSAAVEQSEIDDRLALINSRDSIAFQWVAGDPVDYVPIGQVADKCIEFIQKSESPTEIEHWASTNKMGLQDFWAKAKHDALQVKKNMEDRVKFLSLDSESTIEKSPKINQGENNEI